MFGPLLMEDAAENGGNVGGNERGRAGRGEDGLRWARKKEMKTKRTVGMNLR